MISVIVTGDLVLDHNLVEYPAAPDSYHEPFTKTVEHERAGGAWYLEDLVRLACRDLVDGSQVNILGPQRRACVSEQSVSLALEKVVAPVASAHVIWAMYDRKEGDKKTGKVWRVAKFLGCQRAKLPENPSAAPASGEIAAPDILVLDDLSLGFKDHRSLWPECLQQGAKPRSIVLKLSGLPDDSPLFQHLIESVADRLTVVLSSRLLRLRGAAISQGLSWDRTIEETVEEFEKGRSHEDFARCRRVIVHFRNAGVASFTRCRHKLGPAKGSIDGQDIASGAAGAETQPDPVVRDRVEFERFLYHPDELEGTWESIRPGSTFGTASILTVAIARHELTPKNYPLCIALGRGLAAARIGHEIGGGGVKDEADDFRSDAAHEEIKKQLCPKPGPEGAYPALGFFSAFPHGVLSTEPLRKQPARESNLLQDLTGAGFEYMAAKAVEVVLRGTEKALGAAPKARYGKYSTVDREEIERVNTICRLLKTYLENPKDTKPLSIAVFGPPGSGKSFAIKQLAEQLFGEQRDPLEFNLSQFGDDGVELLREALHQVHDATVKGRIPLVFWDEFDADGLKWLKHFLAPMQDGEFEAAGHIHPLAKAVFVFAGGTKATFDSFDVSSRKDATKEEIDDFVAVKGPDFVSRLRGFVNIKGPNPTGGDGKRDPAHLIRRAMLLRSSLERFHEHLIDKKTSLAAISTSVIRGFLRAEKFLHGARSLESLVAACDLKSAKHFGPAELPPSELLRLHVTSDFLDRVKEGELESPLLEKLAEAIHAAFLKEAGVAPSDPRRRPYHDLSEENKEMNRGPARVTQAKFQEAGYRVERQKPAEPTCSTIVQLDPSTRHRLLEIEHDRWMREKLLAGFEWAAETNRALLLNRDIAMFEDVPLEDQKYDEVIVDAVLTVLSQEGYRLVKEEGALEKPLRLAVRAVIRDGQGRCLLLRRSPTCKAFVGTWEWPGGKADPGESFDVAVRREVVEETGLVIEMTGVAGAFHIEMPQQHVAVLCLEAKPAGGLFRLSEEHDQSAWAPMPDLLQWNLTAGFREFVETYVKGVLRRNDGHSGPS